MTEKVSRMVELITDVGSYARECRADSSDVSKTMRALVGTEGGQE